MVSATTGGVVCFSRKNDCQVLYQNIPYQSLFFKSLSAILVYYFFRSQDTNSVKTGLKLLPIEASQGQIEN